MIIIKIKYMEKEYYCLLNKSDKSLYVNTKVENGYLPIFTSKSKAIEYINRKLVNVDVIKIKIDAL